MANKEINCIIDTSLYSVEELEELINQIKKEINRRKRIWKKYQVKEQ